MQISYINSHHSDGGAMIWAFSQPQGWTSYRRVGRELVCRSKYFMTKCEATCSTAKPFLKVVHAIGQWLNEKAVANAQSPDKVQSKWNEMLHSQENYIHNMSDLKLDGPHFLQNDVSDWWRLLHTQSTQWKQMFHYWSNEVRFYYLVFRLQPPHA